MKINKKILIAFLFLAFLVFVPTKNVSAEATVNMHANVKCNCTGKVFGTCADRNGIPNIKLKGPCTFNAAGPDICNMVRSTGQGTTYYKYQSCVVAPTSTPRPTVTPGGPSVTPSPLPTIDPLCVCNAANTCSNKCIFHKQTGITTYVNPVKCAAALNFFATTPSAANKTDWCRRLERTKGDANGDNKVTLLDYFYYLSAKFAGKVPSTVNPDFNGDGQINAEDRAIIIKTL